jgi:hypothetical protein
VDFLEDIQQVALRPTAPTKVLWIGRDSFSSLDKKATLPVPIQHDSFAVCKVMFAILR